jgi:Fe-S cluster assembly iron-binding protein IscA
MKETKQKKSLNTLAVHTMLLIMMIISLIIPDVAAELDDTKKEEDIEITSNGVRILITSSIMASCIQESLDGAQIGYINNEPGKRFIIKNTNAPQCGSCCSC